MFALHSSKQKKQGKIFKKKKTVKTNLCLVKEKEELIGDRLNFDSDYKLEKTSVNVKLNRKYIRKWSL